MFKGKPEIHPDAQGLSRRDFIQKLGLALGGTSLVLAGCTPDEKQEKKTGHIDFRTNPNSGDKISLLGFGAAKWPVTKDHSGKEIVDQEAVNAMVDYALSHGVNYFDSAPGYVQGLSEAALGEALSRHPREQYFVATKLSNKKDTSFEASKTMYEESFKRLKVNVIDYYLVHNIGGGNETKEQLDARLIDNGMLEFLKAERAAGRIRQLGFSYHGNKEVFEHALAYDVNWDFAQLQISYVDWQHPAAGNAKAQELYTELLKRNIPIVVMTPLQGSRLAKLPPFYQEPLKRRDPNASCASWGLRYVAQKPGILCVLSGMSVLDHVVENVETFSPLTPLSEEENTLMESIGEKFATADTIPCTSCQYCMPCPYGIDIPGTFTHYNRCVNEGVFEKIAQEKNEAAAKRIFLVGYDRKVEPARQADHCIGCGQCTAPCPQKIDIPKELENLATYMEQVRSSKGPVKMPKKRKRS